MATVKQRVQAGIAWLNEHEPGWLDCVNGESLDMSYADSCVGGQLSKRQEHYRLDEGSFWRWAYAHDLMQQQCNDMGFDWGTMSDDPRGTAFKKQATALTKEWQRQISKLKGNG